VVRFLKGVAFSLTVAVLCLAHPSYGQQGFPRVQGETLAGKKVALPEAFGGQAVVIMGFTHGSQKQTKEWSQRLKGQGTAWSIAVLQDVPRLVRGMVVHGIKSGTPKEEYDRFLLVYSGEKELKDAAGFETPDDAYVMVVDGTGAIRWRFHGPATDAAVREVQGVLNGQPLHHNNGD
jgi:hypothetical protein